MDSVDLSSFREPGDNQTNNEIYNNTNLLSIRGKNIGDYARKALRIIYSHEELLSSVLPSEAMGAKYHICEHRYDEFFTKLVRPKLVNFLSDERKRERKRQSTKSLLPSSRDHSL
ncbi:unnamed protein product [Rotaria sordida]|uniref:Uncharacterized protein n=1 Tax=Rotaria sordida TaxID=392033 RepID=A0A815IMP8_9BILA|nr:unnamed protein product [Rotaria sordida]CAF1610039.1 unnamed protein product [Rotaria sordida]